MFKANEGNKFDWQHSEVRTVICPKKEAALNTYIHWDTYEDGSTVTKEACEPFLWSIQRGIISLGFDEETDTILKAITENESLSEDLRNCICPTHLIISKWRSVECYYDKYYKREEEVSIYALSDRNISDILKAVKVRQI